MEEVLVMPKTSEKAVVEPTAASLSIHGHSHMLTKLRPKIRIIHIVAPEIIKTDAANFRELVQRLTGKPTKGNGSGSRRQRKFKKALMRSMPMAADRLVSDAKAAEFRYRPIQPEFSYGGWIKGEEREEGDGVWVGENSGYGGLFSGLGDLDGVIHGLVEYPLLHFGSTTHAEMFGDQSALVPLSEI